MYDLTTTLYINTGGIPYCVFNEIPQQPYTNDNLKNDIIKIHVVYQTSDEIKNVILGKPNVSSSLFDMPTKNPVNFVISMKTKMAHDLGVYGNVYTLIESMNFPKWLHDFTEGNPFKNLYFENIYVPTILYVVNGENQRGINTASFAFDLINSVCDGFTYDNNGGIYSSKPQAKMQSYRIKNPEGVAYTLQNTKSFLDSTMFFNQAMQGKYFPIMHDGELKYLHFIAEFTTPTFYG